jgi:DNA-binding PadR family transcriptional regulator
VTFVANSPTFLILTSLASGPKHGYALAQDIEAFAGVALGPGTLYGAITRLERERLIEPDAPAGDRRQPYRITPAGQAELRTHVAQVERVASEARSRLTSRARHVEGRLA